MIYLKCNYQLLNVQYSSSFLFHLFEVFFSVGSKSPLCPHVSVVLVMNIILPKGATWKNPYLSTPSLKQMRVSRVTRKCC